MRFPKRSLPFLLLFSVAFAFTLHLISPLSHARSTDALMADVQTLVSFGARVTGTTAAEKASQFLSNEYRKAGYEVEIQTFSYPKFMDLGTSLKVNGTPIEAWALVGSIAGEINGKLIAIPNFGRPDDFANRTVKGAIAVIKRGEIPFSQKVENATKAGAIAVILINNEPGKVRGTLTETPKIPAIIVSQEQGTALIEQANRSELASVSIKARELAPGRNVIARKKGVTQPKLIIGAHFDSVRDSPGANDNASGSAVILGMARELAKTPVSNQVWFVAFDGEEDGLQGARSFVKQAKPEFLKQLKGMVNFDMVGINEQLLVQGSPSLYAEAKTISPNVSSGISGGSDHQAFRSQQVPVLFFHRGLEPNYHSPNDKTVNSRLLNETKQTALKIVQQILK